jgi:hypothetical protein
MNEIPGGKYALYFDIIRDLSGCEFSLWQRQKQVSEWISAYNPIEERARELFVCDIDMPDTKNTLTIRFKTDKKKNSLLLNRIKLIRK